MSTIKPIQKFQMSYDTDIEFMRDHLESINAMLVIMHGALTEIANYDAFSPDAVVLRNCALTTLCEAQRIGLTLGISQFVKNYGGQNAQIES